MMGEMRVIDERQAFFTPAGLATYLAVSERTVWNLLASGDLPSYCVGRSRRVNPADVDTFLANHREERTVA